MGKLADKEYEIHYYEVDYRRKVLIASILNYFEDSAMRQTEELGVGLEYLKENNIVWVLYKWDVTIHRYPVFGEKIIVRTMPHSFRKFYAYRTHDILDMEGNVLATGVSVWFLINTEKRRPVKINDNIYEVYGINTVDNSEIPIEKINELTEVTSEKEFSIRYSDIDTNLHVNNVKYASWMIEAVPQEIVMNYSLVNIRVTYEKETTYGETVKSLCQLVEREDGILCVHKIVDNNKKLTVGETVWKKQ